MGQEWGCLSGKLRLCQFPLRLEKIKIESIQKLTHIDYTLGTWHFAWFIFIGSQTLVIPVSLVWILLHLSSALLFT